MLCYVYASRRRADTYIWLRRLGDVDALPHALRERVGELRFVIEVELTAERRLPNADPKLILEQLARDGWYLQVNRDDNGA